MKISLAVSPLLVHCKKFSVISCMNRDWIINVPFTILLFLSAINKGVFHDTHSSVPASQVLLILFYWMLCFCGADQVELLEVGSFKRELFQ